MQYLKIFLLTFLLTASFQVHALESKYNFEVRVAVVDVQSILEHSTAILGVRKTIENISQEIQKYISAKDNEFKKIEEELVKKRNILKEEAFEKEVKIFNNKVSEAQKEMQLRKTKLEQAHAGAIAKVHEVTIEIISELAKKYNVNIVLPSSQVLFAKGELNITTEVLTILNDRLKNVKVTY